MSDSKTIEERVAEDESLIDKHAPGEVEEFIEDSLFTQRELVAYLLAERTDMTWEEAAEEMGISYGTYSGKMGNNVAEKKKRARATVKLINAIEGE